MSHQYQPITTTKLNASPAVVTKTTQIAPVPSTNIANVPTQQQSQTSRQQSQSSFIQIYMPKLVTAVMPSNNPNPNGDVVVGNIAPNVNTKPASGAKATTARKAAAPKAPKAQAAPKRQAKKRTNSAANAKTPTLAPSIGANAYNSSNMSMQNGNGSTINTINSNQNHHHLNNLAPKPLTIPNDHMSSSIQIGIYLFLILNH